VAERVRTFLSGELEVAAAAAVVDPSLHRERAEQA